MDALALKHLSLDAAFDAIKVLNSALQRARRLAVIGPLESSKPRKAFGGRERALATGESKIIGQPRPGTFLVAHPMVPSSHFHKSVILILSYSPKEGAQGVVINPWHVDAMLPSYARLTPPAGLPKSPGARPEESAPTDTPTMGSSSTLANRGGRTAPVPKEQGTDEGPAA